jgi:hypothetical protein
MGEISQPEYFSDTETPVCWQLPGVRHHRTLLEWDPSPNTAASIKERHLIIRKPHLGGSYTGVAC